jgi:5-hydroxyisourate hydrolase
MIGKSPITTHVLDLSRGRPAAGVAVRLEVWTDAGIWQATGEGVTDADGRITDLLAPTAIVGGRYRLTFATGPYFASLGTTTFYPSVTIEFTVTPAEHYHVPLLLSPFGYSTYRGS